MPRRDRGEDDLAGDVGQREAQEGLDELRRLLVGRALERPSRVACT